METLGAAVASSTALRNHFYEGVGVRFAHDGRVDRSGSAVSLLPVITITGMCCQRASARTTRSNWAPDMPGMTRSVTMSVGSSSLEPEEQRLGRRIQHGVEAGVGQGLPQQEAQVWDRPRRRKPFERREPEAGTARAETACSIVSWCDLGNDCSCDHQTWVSAAPAKGFVANSRRRLPDPPDVLARNVGTRLPFAVIRNHICCGWRRGAWHS